MYMMNSKISIEKERKKRKINEVEKNKKQNH